MGLIPKAQINESLSESSIFPNFSDNIIKELKKQKIVFSFSFLDIITEEFNLGGTSIEWFIHLFVNIKEISNYYKNEFIQNRNHYDVHPLKWDKPNYTHKKFNINDKIIEQIDPGDQIQFRLSSSGGRVHGFFHFNVFYVVWLDHHHYLDPDKRFGGVEYFNAPLTPYQELEIEYYALKNKLEKLDCEVNIILNDLYSCEQKLKTDCKK